MNLGAYFQRIRFQGQLAVTRTGLGELAIAHLRTIPFENIDPVLNRGVDVSLSAIAAKLVDSQRGGYCFEHNGLFCAVLNALGFRTTPLAARVVWGVPADAPPRPRTHRLTLVHLPEGAFITDVGFGGQSPPMPLRLDTDALQESPLGHYRILPHAGSYELQMQTPERWAGMYRFTLEPAVQADFEMGNWYTSAHPNSHFRHDLMAAIVVGDARWNLLNRDLTIRAGDGTVSTRQVGTVAEFGDLLRDGFRIALPCAPEVLWACLPQA